MRKRMLVRVASTAIVLAMGLFCTDIALDGTAQADLGQPGVEEPEPDWAPPDWHPDSETLLGLSDLDAVGPREGLRLRSQAAFVYDVDSGEVLYERAADDRRPVASLTKLVTALAVSSEEVDLDAETCVSELFWPSRSGARSRMSTGECYTGWDLLGAALVASDNRAAYGLGVSSGLSYYDFIARMDAVSVDLGMTQSTWADPSGLEDDNLSTARDMTRASLAVAVHPVLSIPASARSWTTEKTVEVGIGPRVRSLHTTNRASGRDDIEWLSAKIGYTDTARYCFSGVFRTMEGRTIAVTLLGANRGHHRWTDLDRVIRSVWD